ncbi:CCD33 protein, partial [Dromas ardeola]|nr:CCD33 protein [Dromas ardeola]
VPMAGKAEEPRIPLALQRSRLKAEEKTLDFEFEVVSAQFNRRGRYALRLTVENPLLQGSSAGIRLRINNGEVTQSSTGTTDTIEQSDLNQIYSFQKRKFTFTLPRGFCKNDKNHDVRLHIEALCFPGRAERTRRNRQVGEAFFAIYPRTNQPRMKLSAGRDEDWYRYSAIVALLRVGSEQPAMHCGRLAFTASLHEHRPPTTLASPPPPSPSTQEEGQQAASTVPASPALDIPVPIRSIHTPESAYRSLPTEGHACSSEWHSRSPSPKSTLTVGARMARPGRGSPSVTSPSQAAARSMRTPSFIPLSLTSPSNQIRGESIKARLAGGEQGAQSQAREMRGREMTLLLPAASGRGSGGGGQGARGALSTRHQAAKWLLASLCTQRTCVPTSCPPREGRGWLSWAQTFYFHQRRLECEGLPPPPLPACLVGPGIPSQPKAPLAKMSVANPQLFSTTAHKLFSLRLHHNAGDLLGKPWKAHLLTAPGIGADTLLMDRVCGRELGHDSPPAAGSRVWERSYRGGSTGLITALSLLPTPLWLIKPRSPSSPCSFGGPATDLLVNDFIKKWGGGGKENKAMRNITRGGVTLPCPSPTEAEKPPRSSALGWQEVGSYRLALKRMAGDLLSLRQHVTSLEVENECLRRSLASQEELGHTLLADHVAPAVAATLKRTLAASTAEMRRLKDRIQQLQNELIRKNDREKDLVLLQRAHRQQQAALRRCQEKVAKTKGLEETVQQQEKVIEVMERVLQKKLTRAGRSPEKPAGHIPVATPPHPTGEALSGEVYAALLAENHRLREELARPHHSLPPIPPRPPALPGAFGGAEKISLLAKLEEAQARGRVLERQLEEAARRWGREKQDLGTRLLEREHGF